MLRQFQRNVEGYLGGILISGRAGKLPKGLLGSISYLDRRSAPIEISKPILYDIPVNASKSSNAQLARVAGQLLEVEPDIKKGFDSSLRQRATEFLLLLVDV
jgi:hypothetical protein